MHSCAAVSGQITLVADHVCVAGFVAAPSQIQVCGVIADKVLLTPHICLAESMPKSTHV